MSFFEKGLTFIFYNVKIGVSYIKAFESEVVAFIAPKRELSVGVRQCRQVGEFIR